MARAAGGAVEDVLHALADVRGLREQDGRIEVALHGDVVAHGRPARVQIDAPVEADHVAAGGAHRGQERRRAGAEVDDRRALPQRADQRARVRQHERPVVVGREHADPRVEDLHRLGAGGDLTVEIARGRVDEDAHEAAPALGLLVHESLGVEIVARGAALDDIRRHRERRARKADQRHLPAQRALHAAHGLEHERHRGLDVDAVEPRDRGLAAEGAMDDRALSLRELEPDAERLDDQQDVGEEDRRVDAQPRDGLERDLGRRLGVASELEEPVPLAHRAVFRQVAPGLPHEPDGSVRRRRPARGA